MEQDENPYRSPESEIGNREESAPAAQENVTVGDWLRDSMVGFVLVLLGFALAGILRLPPLSLPYPIALWVGLLPVSWFAKWRRVTSADFIDYLGLLGIAVVMSVLDSLGMSEDLRQFFLFLVVPGGIWLYQAARRRWFPKSEKQ